jgi:cysteine-rich repeat protein
MIVQEGVEACDDGNVDPGDGCNEVCMIESCGDGVVQDPEVCDDGNDVDTDECTNMCAPAACGDMIVQEGVEMCDDGNDIDTDDCLTTCVPAACGDSIVQEGVEACDDGNDIDTDECLNTCVAAACGDNVVQAGVEQCDDGNVDSGDGCSDKCESESRFAFVSSTLHTGNMGGLAGADAICQGLADAANLPGTYMAWLSTNEVNGTPATRFAQSAFPYVTVTGVKIADNWADLIDGTIDAALNVTELGGAPPAGNPTCGANSVWSNTLQNGTIFNATTSCSNWTSTAGGSHWGMSTAVNNLWSTWCQGGICSWQEPIYCFQQ